MPKKKTEDTEPAKSTETDEETAKKIPAKAAPEMLEDGFPNPAAMDVWDYQIALAPGQWKEHRVYLYREYPRLDYSLLPERNIQKQQTPLTEEEIRAVHGGGGYVIKLKRKRVQIYDERFALEGEAKLQQGQTWLSATAQAAAETTDPLEGKLGEKLVDHVLIDLKQARAEIREANPAAALKQVAESSAEIMRLGAEKSIEMVVANMPKQFSPMDTIKVFAEISKLQKPQEGGGLTDAITLLDQLGLIKKPETSDPLDQLEKTINVAERFGYQKSGGADSWGTELVRIIAPMVVPIISNIATMLENAVTISINNLQRSAIEKGVQASPRPAKPAPPIEPAALPAVEPETPPPPVAPQDSASSPQEILATKYKEKIMEFLESGRPGDELADWLYDADKTFSTQLANVLQHRPQELAGDPILSRAASHPRAQEFAQEYVARHLQIILEEKEEAKEPEPAAQ